MSHSLPGPLARHIGLLEVATVLLDDDVPTDVLDALAECADGRQLMIARAHDPSLVPLTVELLIRRAAALIAAGRLDVDADLIAALRDVIARMHAADTPAVAATADRLEAAVEVILKPGFGLRPQS